MRRFVVAASVICALGLVFAQDAPQRKRNIIIFVADGLRPGSVNATDTPALWSVRTKGVNFVNSHALFPTLTMPNASAIATGHYPGDTGQSANSIFIGYPVYDTGNFRRPPGTVTPSLEDDLVLGDVNDHFGGDYLGEETLLAAARRQGYSTAAVGKVGPTALQDVTQLNPSRGALTAPTTLILDAATGRPEGVPLSPEVVAMIRAAGLAPAPPPRSQPAGNNTTPGTLTPNVDHQRWLVDAVTTAILPAFHQRGKPFAMVFWSGDPDQTQHAQGDSLNRLVPGINGPTSKAAVRNADGNLKQILDYINGIPDLGDTTDVFVTADHGFSTVSRQQVDAAGHVTRSYSAGFIYKDSAGRQEVNTGFLPNGFLAIDLAHALNLPLFDPDSQITDASGARVYAPVDPAAERQTASVRQRPASSAGLIGGSGRIGTPIDARVVVTGNTIYVPGNDRDTVGRVVRVLSSQDYIGGIFVNDAFGRFPGALPLSAVGVTGPGKLPRPAVIVSFKSFALDNANPLMSAVIVGGTQQQGQGNHGALFRANTFNNMAAIGPDFKKGFVDGAPVGNADVQPTLAHILGLTIPSHGSQTGRVLVEALAGGPSSVKYETKVMRSNAAASGHATVLMYQQVGRTRYFDEACFNVCRPGSPATR